MNHTELNEKLFSNGPNKETQAPIIDFDSLVKNISDSRDKLLLCCIATLADAGMTEQFLNYLVQQPEPMESKLERVMHGVKVKDVMGLNAIQAERAFGITAPQLREIQNYLGLTNETETED